MTCSCDDQSIAVCPARYNTHRTDCKPWSKDCKNTPKNQVEAPSADTPWKFCQEAVQLEKDERHLARWEANGPPDKPIYKRDLGAPGCHAVGAPRAFNVFSKKA